MKVKYLGKTFYDGFGLTNGKVYECVNVVEEIDCLEIIDDEGEEFIYPIENPGTLYDDTEGTKWEIIEDPDNQLTEKFKKLGLI